MEFMDKGSLDSIYKKIGGIDIDVVGKVALAVLEGLTYLYDVHRIIHRGWHFLVATIQSALIRRVKTSNHQIYYATPKERSKYATSAFPAS
jgi:serine/threonine protein kinase